jgi:Fungal Zn(2)-Cys(6) binuclear cluster domain
MGALSKGCGTCKRRKVKCDETHPTCTRCRNADIECIGFAPRLRFVDEGPRIRRSIEVSHKQSHEYSVARGSHLAFQSSRIHRPQPLNRGPFLGNALFLTAFKDDMFMSYLLSEFFEGKDRNPSYALGETRCGLPPDWIPELVKTPQKPRYKSWDALAAIVFGQAHNSCDAVTIALRLYGQALSELRDKLSSPDNSCTDSTLASITALYLCEVSHKDITLH